MDIKKIFEYLFLLQYYFGVLKEKEKLTDNAIKLFFIQFNI